ncbi:MAG: hypothetical protein CL571_02235 [Alphaproteobacteria bacterium]|nr:hypothetical protein [Alphaproteobacteria bacterium]
MKKNRLIIFAIIMSFCTSTTVSAILIIMNSDLNNFFSEWLKRFLISWPTVFFCIIFFVPLINKILDKHLRD